MPMPGAVEPMPLPSLESRCSVPLEAQEASYLAASARISSLRCTSIIKIPLISLRIPRLVNPIDSLRADGFNRTYHEQISQLLVLLIRAAKSGFRGREHEHACDVARAH